MQDLQELETKVLDRRELLKLNLSAVLGVALVSLDQTFGFTKEPVPKAKFEIAPDGFLSPSDAKQIIDEFAIRLPDTPWRAKWVKAYEEYKSFSDLEFSDEKAFEPLYAEFKRKYGDEPFESGGERVFDGTLVKKELGMNWWMLDCSTYCWAILRKEPQLLINGLHSMDDLIASGYFPVKEPQDFDIVLYGSVEESEHGPRIDSEHWGISKDGKVISKDIMSEHVYKHDVLESAAYSTHVMYFRNARLPDPSSLPSPRGIQGRTQRFEWHYVDGVGKLEPIGLLEREDTWIKAAALLGGGLISHQIFRRLKKPSVDS